MYKELGFQNLFQLSSVNSGYFMRLLRDLQNHAIQMSLKNY